MVKSDTEEPAGRRAGQRTAFHPRRATHPSSGHFAAAPMEEAVTVPNPQDLNSIETAVWTAEYVRYLAARCNATEWPPREDDIDDAIDIDNANETVADLRRAKERP